MVGAQYLGFIYAAGIYSGPGNPTGWSSRLASFGFSTVPTGCGSVAPKTSTLIYGGDFDPSTSKDSFGNCDFAIDLGSQDSANNGLYPHATVWVGAGYAGNNSAAPPFSGRGYRRATQWQIRDLPDRRGLRAALGNLPVAVELRLVATCTGPQLRQQCQPPDIPQHDRQEHTFDLTERTSNSSRCSGNFTSVQHEQGPREKDQHPRQLSAVVLPRFIEN